MKKSTNFKIIDAFWEIYSLLYIIVWSALVWLTFFKYNNYFNFIISILFIAPLIMAPIFYSSKKKIFKLIFWKIYFFLSIFFFMIIVWKEFLILKNYFSNFYIFLILNLFLLLPHIMLWLYAFKSPDIWKRI